MHQPREDAYMHPCFKQMSPEPCPEMQNAVLLLCLLAH